jgi:rapamycin-insensitive companion of mTOR
MNDISLIKNPNNNQTLSMLTTFYQQSKSLFQQTQTNYSKLENVRTQVDTSLDETQFQLLIKESNILLSKDFKKWNWEPIFTLVYGPLRLPERLNDSLKKESGKLIKRILSYYQPSKRAFCELAFKEDQMIFADLGCQLLENLLSTQDGIQYLSTSEFFEELKEILEIELSSNPEGNSNRILSEKGVASKLAREYFTMIGKLSSIPQGVKILQNFNIFNLLKKLINSNRDDISQLIIKYLDYTHSNETISSSSRMILKEAMTSSRKNIRYVATLRLRKLLREVKKNDFTKFGIQLLQTQLGDSWEEISKTALQIIASNCKIQPEFLDHFISLNPNIEILQNQKEGSDLLLRMISTENGFDYLLKKGWIGTSLKEWKEKKILEYVINIELSLKKAMTDKKSNEIDLSASADLQVTLSPHFYGEICKTKIGCEYIEKTGHKEEFFNLLDDKKSEKIHKRAILWSLGQMATSDIGYDFVNGDGLVERLVKLAESSSCLSFRGLCMYILSEISKSSKARKRLASFKWEFHIDSYSNVIALPSNVKKFFTIPEYKFEGTITDFEDPYLVEDNQLPPIEEMSSKLILEQLILLGNPVSESGALRELKRLRTMDPNAFLHREIVWRMFHFLEKFKFSRKGRSLLNLLLNEISVMEMDFEYLDSFYKK